MKKNNLEMTPLQRVLGFEVAEEIYDMLPFDMQIALDLKIEGYTDADIARCLGIPRITLYDRFRRARVVLAKSKLKMLLESRVYYQETHFSVIDSPEDLSSNHKPSEHMHRS